MTQFWCISDEDGDEQSEDLNFLELRAALDD